MSNYSLEVDNRRYDPTAMMTQLLQGQKEQEQDLRAAELTYGELSSKASILEKLANDVKGKDSVAYQNYMNYANTLRQHTDLLATQGLNPALWKNLLQAKTDYARMVSPIEEAMQKREEAAKYQAEYLKVHPGAIFERDADSMGIDQWMKNPNYVSKVIDKEVVANRAKERYEAIKNQATQFVTENGGLSALTKDPQKLRQWVKVNVPWMYDSKYTTGVDPDEIKRLMAGDPELQGSLTAKIAEETLDMYGFNSWNTDYDHYTNEQNAQRRYNLAKQLVGATVGESSNAIGQTTFDKYTDQITPNMRIKWAELEEQKRHNEVMENAAKAKDKDPKVHTYYRDVEYIVPNEETKTTKAAQLLALKNLLDKSVDAKNFYRGFTGDQILNSVKSVFGKDITEVDLDDDNNDNKLRKALYDTYKDDNSTWWWSDSSEENQDQYNEFIVNNFVNNTFGVLKPLTKSEYDILKKKDYSLMTLDEKKRLFKYLQEDMDYKPSVYGNGITRGTDHSEEIKELSNQILKEMISDESNPYEKEIDDLIGIEDNDIYDYNTRVNNYIKGATTTYEGAEDNFEGSARTNQSSLLWGQSLQVVRKGNKDIALNVHTLDANGNKVDVKQDDVINALGINKDGEITRPYRMAIMPLRNKKTGEIEVHPMIKTQGYYDDGNYHEGIDFEWNHGSVKENKENRDINLKQMNLNLNRAEAVKKSKEFKNIVANAENIAKSYLESNKIPLTRKNISAMKYAYINQELEKLQKPYIDAYNFHKSEFMRLWGHATGNTNIANSINHDKTGELDADFHIRDLGASN